MNLHEMTKLRDALNNAIEKACRAASAADDYCNWIFASDNDRFNDSYVPFETQLQYQNAKLKFIDCVNIWRSTIRKVRQYLPDGNCDDPILGSIIKFVDVPTETDVTNPYSVREDIYAAYNAAINALDTIDKVICEWSTNEN